MLRDVLAQIVYYSPESVAGGGMCCVAFNLCVWLRFLDFLYCFQLLSGSRPVSAAHAVSSNLTHLHALLLAARALQSCCNILQPFEMPPIPAHGAVYGDWEEEDRAGVDREGTGECGEEGRCTQAASVAPTVAGDVWTGSSSTDCLSDEEDDDFDVLQEGSVTVDLVGNDKQLWVKVVARNPISIQQNCLGTLPRCGRAMGYG